MPTVPNAWRKSDAAEREAAAEGGADAELLGDGRRNRHPEQAEPGDAGEERDEQHWRRQIDERAGDERRQERASGRAVDRRPLPQAAT